jgi:asparagine synthase (glutamine-hydrolysing)
MLTAYLVCREARKSVTVLLSGVGGDEVYAGYRKHAAHRMAALYARLPRAVRRKLLEPAAEAFPTLHGTALMGSVRLAKKFARSASLSDEDAFLMNATYLDGDQKAGLYTPALRDAVAGDDPYDVHRGWLSETRHADFLNRMLQLDLRTFMVSLNLLYNDKMSMASSLEVRVPFLDRGLVQHAFSEIPPDAKLRGALRPTTKHILREAVRGLVPDEVLRQPKAGFGAPHAYWLANDLREMVDDLLGEERVRRRGWFDPAVVRRMVTEQREGRKDWAYPLWLLLTLELWHDAFSAS